MAWFLLVVRFRAESTDRTSGDTEDISGFTAVSERMASTSISIQVAQSRKARQMTRKSFVKQKSSASAAYFGFWSTIAIAVPVNRSDVRSEAGESHRRHASAFPVSIRVDATKARGRDAAGLAVLRLRRAELHVHEGRQEAALATRRPQPRDGLHPHPQPADLRRRHARPEVGLDRGLHRGRPGPARSTTGRSSTASSTPTWSGASGRMSRSASCPRRSRPIPSPTSTSGRRAGGSRSRPAGPTRPRTTRSGPSWSSSGSGTASSGTARPRSRRGTGRSGTSRTSSTGGARPRSTTSSTTSPSTP